MTDREKVMLAVSHCLRSNDCSICEACPYNESNDYGCRARLRDDIVRLLKAQEPQDNDANFMTHIICEICDYAVKNEMEPNDTLLTVADNIKALLKISTFNNWEVRHHG